MWLELLLALFLLDLAIYLQHRLFHYVPVLWRLHRMHHSDLEVDVTTGVRFHPVEILLSLGIKFLIVVPLGAAPLAVLLFEIALNGTSMFNHSNVRVAPAIEWVLRWLVVTPDMHRKGVGGLLLARLIGESTQRGFRQMIAVIGDSAQTSSIALHQACGFRLVGTFEAVGFKFGRWLDSVLMQRQLQASGIGRQESGNVTRPDA